MKLTLPNGTTVLSTPYLNLTDAPAISGLRFRLFQGDMDYPDMVATIHAAKSADQIERSDTLEDMRNNYAHLVNCDPYQDVLIAEVNHQVVGYSRLHWYIDQTSKVRVYVSFGFIRPEWRRKGIGRAMLHHNQARLRSIAAEHPHDMERSFESSCQDTEVENESLLKAEGYLAVRHGFNMVRPDLENIPDLPLPAGLEVKPVTPDQYRTIWDADQEAFRDHWGNIQGTEEDYQKWLSERIFQPELWQVAWDGDQVAGMVQNFIDVQENAEYRRLRGYTENISTRRPWRKQGLARALIARSLHLLKKKGMLEAGLGVDTQNLSGALRLYEFMGFRAVKRASIYRKPMDD
jgi:mycothiol synthase